MIGLEEQKFRDIEETIRRHGYCAVIEVCNGISNRALDNKVDEVNQARKFVKKLTGLPQVDAGIIFCREKKLSEKNIQKAELDFLCQIPKYEAGYAIGALWKTHEASLYDKDKQTALNLIQSVRDGISLKDLIYPESDDWQEFTDRFPQLAQDYSHQDYMNAIGNFKGIFMQKYAAKMCKKAIPGALFFETVCYGEHATNIGLRPSTETINGVTRSYCGRGEIDIIITGKHEDITKGLSNPAYFTALRVPETAQK